MKSTSHLLSREGLMLIKILCGGLYLFPDSPDPVTQNHYIKLTASMPLNYNLHTT